MSMIILWIWILFGFDMPLYIWILSLYINSTYALDLIWTSPIHILSSLELARS